MARSNILFIIYFLAMKLAQVKGASSEDSIFTGIAPKLIRPHSTYVVFVTLESSAQPTMFEAEIRGRERPKLDENNYYEPRPVPLVRKVATAPTTTAAATTTTTTPPPPPLKQQTYSSELISIKPGSSTLIELQVEDLQFQDYNLTIKAATATEVKYERTTKIFKDTTTKSILIQSDKSIYKPGETVKYRVVALDRNLVPLKKESLEVIIKDPQGNVIRDLKGQPTQGRYGLFSSKLELSTEPNLGQWSIQVKTRKEQPQPQPIRESDGEDDDDDGGDDAGEDDSEDSGDIAMTSTFHYFSVEKYILPKFKVDLKLTPPFITYNNSKVTVQVDAKYTYGKGLKGFCQITITEPYPMYYYSYSYSYEYNDAGGEQIGPGPRPKVKSVVKKLPIDDDGQLYVEFDIMKELVEQTTPTGKGKSPAAATFPPGGDSYQPQQQQQREFTIFASVTDTLTGRAQNSTTSITMYPHPYKFELIKSPTNYKPGFPLTLYVQISTQDGLPVEDKDPHALSVKHGFSCKDGEGELRFPIPRSGIVKVVIQVPSNELLSTTGLEVSYKGQTQTLYIPQKIFSKTKSYIQLTMSTEEQMLAVGSEVKFTVRTNKPFSSLHYVLYGRGDLLATDKIQASGTGGELDEFSLQDLPLKSAPESTLVVYAILKSTNEIIADSVKLKVELKLNNHLSLKFSQGPSVEPGKNISLHLGTAEHSLVALRGVDESVLLLKQDQDITQRTIDGEIQKFQHLWSNFRNWGGSSSFQVFDEAGLIVLTNGQLEKEEHYYPRPYFRGYRHGGGGGGRMMFKAAMSTAASMEMDEAAVGMAAPMNGGEAGRSFSSAPSEIRIRSNFPESWLWEEVYANESMAALHTIVPDTLTTWFVTGYSLHPKNGIGLSGSPYKIQVFRSFFLTLNVPYSIVEGETFGLQVLVHNYLNDELKAEVSLDNSEGHFEFNEKVNMFQPNFTKSVTVGASSVSSVIFVITPIAFGNIALKVKGHVGFAGDGLNQPLIVKPPGRLITKNTAVLVDLRNVEEEEGSFQAKLEAQFPKHRVHGSDQLKVSIVGDLLTSTIRNLDKLIQMPCGCGEQNLLNFVPDIVILDYLSETGQLTPPIRTKAIRFLEAGYQRQLTYRHHDGSFSAFGPTADPHGGSTWLTAFTIKSFIAAASKGYLAIDKNVVGEGLQFLVGKQQQGGSFIELGRVFHSDMQGGAGAGNSLALTAYVLLTLIQARVGNYTAGLTELELEPVIQKGFEFLRESQKLALTEPYSMVLITYAATLANHQLKDVFFENLDQALIKDGDLIHVDKISAAPPPPKEGPVIEVERFHLYDHHFVRPVAVEMSSYALMTYLARGDLATGLGLVKWLLMQSNGGGGFQSTQDTVVGLTALAKFASIIKSKEQSMKVKVKYEDVEHEADVNDENNIVLQEFHFKPSASAAAQLIDSSTNVTTRQVTVNAEGKGTALVSLTWSYHVQQGPPKPAFSIDVKVHPIPASTSMSLTICTRLLQGTKSNMAVQEVNLPSGYAFTHEDLTVPAIKNLATLKRFELENEGTKLELYFDYFEHNSTTCITLEANQLFKVANPSKAFVRVYDYYDTTLSAVSFYQPPAVHRCEICVNEIEGGGGGACAIQNC